MASARWQAAELGARPICFGVAAAATIVIDKPRACLSVCPSCRHCRPAHIMAPLPGAHCMLTSRLTPPFLPFSLSFICSTRPWL